MFVLYASVTSVLIFVLIPFHGNIAAVNMDMASRQDMCSSRQDGAFCPMGFFLCNGTDNICIEQKQNCDGKKDCPNGTDEINCDNKVANAFWDHQFKKNVAASEDDDDKDPKCVLAYNGTCFCKRMSILCQHKKFSKAPDDLPSSKINLLDFTGNNFDVLDPHSLESLPVDVDTLVLNHCAIKEVGNETFFKLSSISKLHLDNNLLKMFPNNIFLPENNLWELYVRHNSIEYIAVGAFDALSQLETLDLSNNKLSEIRRELLEPLVNLKSLILRSNRISSIKPGIFPALPLNTLSLASNRIEAVESESFVTLPTLSYLFLSNNSIQHLVNGTFENLAMLVGLHLNENKISVIETGVFQPTCFLESLDLRKNVFKNMSRSVFLPLQKLDYIYFDRFEMCKAALHVRVCEPSGDGISSQYHLLDNPVLRASVWIMGIIGCFGNLIVFLGRLLTPTTNKVHSLYIRNLALSDLLMGIYLLTIAAADHHYRGVYLIYEQDWRRSTCCNICGFLSTLSCESSVLILSLVTWDRFISITQPLARRQPSPRTAGFTLVVLWLLATVVAAAPLLEIAKPYFGDKFYRSNGVCLSLHIHDPYTEGWEYSAAMFVCVNSLALVFICYAYLRMIHEIRASGVACRSTQQSQERDKVAQRFGVIVLTDCLCWVPVIIVKLAALSGLPIPATLYAWLAVLVLPINSALNPVLYTLTTTVFKKQMRKVYNSCIHKHRRPEHQNSAYDSSFSLSLGIFPIGGSTKRTLTYRGTQSSLASSKNSWRSTAV